MSRPRNLNLLQGDLLPTIIRLGYPTALASAAQTLYNLADTFWLGKLGRQALAAPVISFHIIFFIIAIGMGFSLTATALVSQYTGAGQPEKARQAAGNILVYSVGFSFVLAALGLIFERSLLRFLGTPEDTFYPTLIYLRIMLWGMPLAFPFFVYQSTMHGYGDTMSPLKVELISVGLNLAVDPILIFGWLGMPALGVAGAALATVFTRGLSSLIGLHFLFSRTKGLSLNLHHLRPETKILPLMFRIGLPSSVGMSGTSLGFLVLLGIVNAFGSVIISAYGISTRVVHLFMMPSLGVSHAVTAIVGQNLGARRPDRAKAAVRLGIRLVLLIIVPSMILVAALGKQLTIFFIPDDPLVHEIGGPMFLLVAPAVLFFSLAAVLNGAFQGSGFTVPVMVSNLSRIWLFRIPAVYLLCMLVLGGPGTSGAALGIWWGMLLSNFLAFVMIGIWYGRGAWTRARITLSDPPVG
ncbi:MAG: MATE family efflux transporter [Acidobacteria bacterium]|nr:MATE family efflux transporter [Acidobacteriota bacterium]